MSISKIIKGLLLLSSVLFIANCSKDNAILDPNDSGLRKPLFSVTAVTSYRGTMGKALANTSNAPMEMIQASSNPVMMLVWMREDGRKDTFYTQTNLTSTGWPLHLRTDLFDVPDPGNLRSVPGSANSKFGVAAIILVNDGDRNGQFRIWNEELAQLIKTRDSLNALGLPDSTIQNKLNNYGFFADEGSKTTHEYWMGISSSAYIIYLSDTTALRYLKNEIKNNPNPYSGNYSGEDLTTGYNIMQPINARHITVCDTVIETFPNGQSTQISCNTEVVCDRIYRLEDGTDIDISLFTSWDEFENTHTNYPALLNPEKHKLIW
ncbi:MAG: hypothetical protein JNL74_03925 [Fibrobacteres bacterium]|nr:hypothetical protein [Fibrobacterota bacterium]